MCLASVKRKKKRTWGEGPASGRRKKIHTLTEKKETGKSDVWERREKWVKTGGEKTGGFSQRLSAGLKRKGNEDRPRANR